MNIHHPAPLAHSTHVLFVSFLLIFFFLLAACPHSIAGPPPFLSSAPLLCRQHCNIIPPSSVCQSLDNLHTTVLIHTSSTQNKVFHHPLARSVFSTLLLLLAGDIEINPGPTNPCLQFAHLNVASASSITHLHNKPMALQEFITDQCIEILAISETWLSPSALPSTICSLIPSNFSMVSNPRPSGRGGGVAFIYRSYLHISTIAIPTFPSFEAICIKLSIASSSFIFLTIYRPPSTSIPNFIADFTSLIDTLNCSPSELIISGDFNIHVDTPLQSGPSAFLDSIETAHLHQHVTFPTHKLGHTLDLLLSRSSSTIITSVDYTIPFISDHYAIHATITVPINSRRPLITKLVRSTKSIDTMAFSDDLINSPLYTTTPGTLDTYVCLFTSTVSSLLDQYAPLKRLSYPARTEQPFMTPTIRAAKSVRSKLESTYRRTKSSIDFTLFKNQSHALAKLLISTRRKYYRSLITCHKNQPRKLWSTLNSLLSRKTPTILPSGTSNTTLASSFLNFFDGKITKLCMNFKNPKLSLLPCDLPRSPPPCVTCFELATAEEVRCAILAASDSTCSLDVIPTNLLKTCLPAFLYPITTIVNLSLSEGTFPSSYKHALVKPMLKKYNLPAQDLSSYRPISNLNFISKIIERIIHTRLSTHLNSFPSLTPFQSAYRNFHSTETALLYIQNDLLKSMDSKKVSALVLLDLSAAFDTIDHTILLSRLSSFYGITDLSHSLISSYLTNRTQSIVIDSSATAPSPIITGVPQGSVLGPLLFSLYTSPLSQILDKSAVSFHLYADDTQLYISFAATNSSNSLNTLSTALESVHAWLTSNRLSVNPSKTEYLLIGTRQQRFKITASNIQFQGTTLTPSNSVQNLGFIFEQDLSHNKHISSVCQTSFHHIRQLRQIRSSLDTNSAIILANSLVTSRLDYCNSLYYGLPDFSIYRLQRVQNALARVVLPFIKRYDHITPALQRLHWLPIKERIIFKIATLTFKTLHNHQPSYLNQVIIRHNPTRSLRTLHQNQLARPTITSENGRRSFAYAAPFIWNNLPATLRDLHCLTTFRTHLKTHLFPA